MKARRTVVLGILGSTVDAGLGVKRWNRWRPTVAIGQQPDLVVSRFELLHDQGHHILLDQVVADLGEVSPETKVNTHPISWDDPWDFESVYGALFEFALRYPFDAEREDYLVHITTGTHVAQICLFLLTESRHIPGRLLQTSPGARTRSPEGTTQIIDLDLSRYDRLAQRFHETRTKDLSFLKAGIETKNARFNRLVERIEEVAAVSPDPLLLTGPTGAGKSQLARRIYDLKKARARRGGEFVEVNCATVRGDGAMSALFGHVKGAFTGAGAERAGLLRRAHGGTLFLDEIGELGLDEQAMLLRAVESKTFLPVGSDREVTSEFQLIAGTNRDLRARVREGLFRDDLLARIDLWTFALPPLRERLEDLPPNLDFELRRQSERLGTLISMSRDARALYLEFATSPTACWPGNFRDLAASVTRMSTLAKGGRIDVALVREEVTRLAEVWSDATAAVSVGGAFVERVLGIEGAAGIDRFDLVQLDDVLAVCHRSASLSEAGRTLFAESRRTKTSSNDADRLRKYLARFGLSFDVVRRA